MLTLLALLACNPQPDTFARAEVVADLSHTIGGPKAALQPGDFLLENDRIRVGILGARPSMGPGVHGGSLVDADLQWYSPETSGGHGRDAFVELIPTVSMNVTEPWEEGGVSIVSDGSDGGPAIVRVVGEGQPFISLLGALWAMVDAPDWHLVTDYVLEPGASWVTIRTTAMADWPGGEALPVEGEPVDYVEEGLPVLDWAVTEGLVLGEFYLSGGSVDVFAPGMGYDEDGAVYEAWLDEVNTFVEPFRFEYLAGTADGVSYGLAPVEGALYVPLFTSSQTAAFGGGVLGTGEDPRFEPGSAYTYERRFYVGHGDVGSIVDAWLESTDQPWGEVHGYVLEEGTSQPLSGVDVLVYEPGADRPWSQWETDVDPRDELADGSFGGRLPPGEWELVAHHHGRPDSERISVVVEEGGSTGLVLEHPRPGLVHLTVRDETGRAVPAKITLFRLDDEPRRDPVKGDGFIAGSPEMVLFSLYGEHQVELAQGRYQAVASRGLEYELDTVEFEVEPTTRTQLDLMVYRSVQSDGWISADLHVHAAPSHDSGIVLADRVRTMAAEGVEFFASTDHDVVTDYAPVVEDLGMEEWVSTAVGVETTTVEIGHFIGFPLVRDHLAEAGGAFDWTDMPPEEIMEDLRELGRSWGYEPILTVPHPRSGILGYFDQYGFDPYGGFPGTGGEPGTPSVQTPLLAATNPLLARENLSWEFDSMEVMNGKMLRYVRTPTQAELDRYAQEGDLESYEILERTLAEQQDLAEGVYRLGYGHRGQIDDWFTLTNLGFRFTALGNSDTHGFTHTEAGCPRNFVMSGTDDPAYLDPQEVAEAVREHRVVASYGPFVQLWVEGQPIGSEVVPAGETIEVEVDVQAPTWMDVDRVELYENGTLIAEWAAEDSDVVRLSEAIQLQPAQDSWYAVIAMGDGDLGPIFTPVEIPSIELDQVVTEALGGVEAVSRLLSPAVPIPLQHPVHPLALTNPVWVDLDGDGFDAPGLPDWLEPPQEPED